MNRTNADDKRQTFRSEYGRKGITVSIECPTFAINRRLGRTHVGESDETVTAMIREAIAEQRAAGNDKWTDKAERDAIRYALWQHAENRASYAWVMGSH